MAETKVFRQPFRARFQDIDAAGILFFGRNFDAFHDTYVAFLEAIGFPLAESLRDGSLLLPLVHAEGDFRRPIRFGEGAEVQLSLSRLGRSSYTVRYRMVDAEGQALTEGETVHCCVDAASFAGRPLPDTLRAALSPYLSEP